MRKLATKNKDRRDLMKIRDMENTDMFRSFVNICLQHTKSKIDWQYERQEVMISNFFSVFDESFIILLMMNSWEEFELMAKGEKIPRGNRKTLFTNCNVEDNDTTSSNGSSIATRDSTSSISVSSVGTSSNVRGNNNKNIKKIKGWSVKGIERYNEIIKHVCKMRQKQEQKDMENCIMIEYSTLDESKKRKRKRDESSLESEIEIDAFDAYNFDPTAV